MEQNYKNKIILVSDFGRSGQGWLSYMLCYILNARFIEPYALLDGRKHSSSDYVLSLTQGNLPGREATSYSLVVKTHSYPAKAVDLTDKIIFLMRDPRDVAVSAYYWQKFIAQKLGIKNFLGKAYLTLITKIKILSYFLTITKWEKHYFAWKRIDYFCVRYESILADTKKELKRILIYLEVDIEEKIIEEAIKNFSFENITGRKRGQEDKTNPEFRKGIAGDYKNKFSALELKIINFIFKKLFKATGYDL